MKKKLNLNAIKVKSFVMDLEKSQENTVKGGIKCVSCGGVLDGCTLDMYYCAPASGHLC